MRGGLIMSTPFAGFGIATLPGRRPGVIMEEAGESHYCGGHISGWRAKSRSALRWCIRRTANSLSNLVPGLVA